MRSILLFVDLRFEETACRNSEALSVKRVTGAFTQQANAKVSYWYDFTKA